MFLHGRDMTPPRLTLRHLATAIIGSLLLGATTGCGSGPIHNGQSEAASPNVLNASDSAVRTGLAPSSPPSPSVEVKAPDTSSDQTPPAGDRVAIEGLEPVTLQSAFGRVVDTCQINSAKRKPGHGRAVLLIQQWRVPPQINTLPAVKGQESALNRNLPQAEHQIAIYRILDDWLANGAIKTVLVDGCQYGITRGFESRFNGWNLHALEKRSLEPDYASVITHIGLKIEAKLGPMVDTICVDNDLLMRSHEFAFSDARGIMAFLSAINGKDESDQKVRALVASVVELYKLPPQTKVAAATARLRSELKDVIGRLERGYEERNAVMMKRIKRTPSKPLAFVVGGAHIPGLRRRLEREGIPCAIIEPKGYQARESEFLQRLQNEFAR